MYRSSALFLLLVLAPAGARASDPTGLLPFMLGQLALVVWPLVLPVFFLRGGGQKIKDYLLFTLPTFGVLGLTQFPMGLYINHSGWFSLPLSRNWHLAYVVGANFFAITIATVLLLKFAGRLRAAFARPIDPPGREAGHP